MKILLVIFGLSGWTVAVSFGLLYQREKTIGEFQEQIISTLLSPPRYSPSVEPPPLPGFSQEEKEIGPK